MMREFSVMHSLGRLIGRYLYTLVESQTHIEKRV